VYLDDFIRVLPSRAAVLVIAWLLASASRCPADDIHVESTGARFGFNPIGDGDHFRQAEAFVNWDLPWNWDLGSLWRLQSRFDFSAGWLGESSANAAIFEAGLTLALNRQPSPLSFEVGLAPAGLTRTDFISKDFGSPFQFITHAGVNLDLFSRLRLSYRFQHMSNADINHHNPGLNLHMFGLSYVF
jgi:hypothetical protein